ncbi:hypothetical protein K7432_008079 [Basidiobolus ranarum]|uniref:Uncharacterized protein n=1 Tax=Basidiobolus ranarum TaxID=34480 RepID=A0ABR2VZ57_9FUNG
MKSKLENFYRELQQEYTSQSREESSRIAHEEQKKREQISGKFEKAIEDIRVKMDLDSEENKKRVEDNNMLKEKFKSFLEQYELREQHHTYVLKSKDLELQLLEAKINQHGKNA